jgi:hypothetical protein
MSIVTLVHKEYRLIRVDPDLVDSLVPVLVPILETSIPYTSGYENAENMLEVMKKSARPWQLWLMLKGDEPIGAFISTLQRLGDEVLFQFEILAGVEAQDWILPMIHKFEQYLHFMYGVTQIRIVGREGWSKFLRDNGYIPHSFITTKLTIVPDPKIQDELARPAVDSNGDTILLEV